MINNKLYKFKDVGVGHRLNVNLFHLSNTLALNNLFMLIRVHKYAIEKGQTLLYAEPLLQEN